MSNPNIDTKGIIREKGISLCDHEMKKFYSAKILPAMVYGYLMQAAKLQMKIEEKEIIKAELTMDENISKSKIIGLDGFNVVGNRLNLKKGDKKEIKIGDILTWIGMGKKLYDSTKSTPTEWDILKIIRKDGKMLAMCPFNQMEWNKNHGGNKVSVIKNNTVKSSSKNSESKKSIDTSKTSKSSVAEDSSKTEKRVDSCASGNCPHLGVQGKYTFYVERFEEYYNTDPKKWTKANAKKNSTISYFSILDPLGKKLEGYDGYVIEPGGPDQIMAERNQRIVEGTHNLRWHYKSKTKHSPAYMSILVHSKKISPNRGILIHWGHNRGWSAGCLIPSTERSIMSDRKIYKAVNSMSFFDKIMNFAYKIEKINKKSRTVRNKFGDMEGEVPKEAIKGKSINNIVLVVKNNIKRSL